MIIYIYIYIYIRRVFANGPGDRGSLPGRVILNTQKMVLDAPLLNTQHYKVQIKVKWSNLGEKVASFLTPWCCIYWKRSIRVVLDNGRPTYIYITLYIFINSFRLIKVSFTEVFPVRSTADNCNRGLRIDE